MKTVSANLATHLSGEATTMATLWRVVRQDGAVFTFTDHDADIVYGGETYAAALGYQRAAIASGGDLAVDETELMGLLDSASIDAVELRAGLWDHAAVTIFAVNYLALADGPLRLRRGWLGEVVLLDTGMFRAELRGLAQPLQNTIGGFYQPECRADLGDTKCRVDLTLGAGWTQQATIDSVTDSVTLVMSSALSSFADAYFTNGVAIWDTGANAGVAREVIAWAQSGRVLSLFSPPPFAPGVGDTLRIQPGCDKRASTCKTTFDNFLNFRGEPFVPGALGVLEVPT
jgi:uncharacterized phage protein (TIGR02218 family)